MPDLTNIQLPPPENWQDFERLCHSTWKAIWRDRNAQMNGRAGQAQHGVDVFGRPHDAAGIAGVQCKGKDTRFGHAVTEDELRAEVTKARTFKPPLAEFTLATTAEVDAKIQEVARKITEEHHQTGLFRVSVFGWQEIHARLVEFPDVLDIHYPQLGLTGRKTLEAINRVEERQGIRFDSLENKTVEVWAADGPSEAQARKLTYALLQGIDPGRSPHCMTFWAALQQGARVGVLPSKAWSCAIGWYEGHFLLRGKE